MPDLLFEIGTEEIPARFMDHAIGQLAAQAASLLDDRRLSYAGLSTYGTPRRLALVVKGLSDQQRDLEKEVKGPARKAAFDAEGKPTKAALGFAKSQGVDIGELQSRDTGNGDYLYAVVRERGKQAAEILPELLVKLVAALSFPKPMRWGYEEMRFARPIRWIVALYGNQVLELELAGVEAGRETRGHRFLSTGTIVLNSPDEYLAKLEQNYVLVDQEQRKAVIWEQIAKTAQAYGGFVEKDEELLEEVTYLVEYPTALCGSFNAKYLELPVEVLVTPMKEHQRYFPVWSAEGQLLPKFITVRNGSAEHLDTVTAGNVKVLLARLADARFFYEEDQKVPLQKRVEQLKKVVFQEELGTIYAKVERLQKLATSIAHELGLTQEQVGLIAETAYLCKADLVTNMVFEFPELQGIMGSYYAGLEKYDQAVAQGIREHYLPKFAGDKVPEGMEGIAVSIADKLDTIIGCFGVGLIPTGSQDPYALRRQALGICHTIIHHRLPLSLTKLITQAYEGYGDTFKKADQGKVQELLLQFFRQRLQNILEDKGLRYDINEAVLSVGFDNPADVVKRAQELQQFSQKAEFEALVTAFSRAANLTKNTKKFTVQAGFFTENVERDLFDAVTQARSLVEKEIRKANYAKALEIVSSLREPVDKFFAEVMVMVEDAKIKENRIALLQMVTQLTYQIADLSKLVIK